MFLRMFLASFAALAVSACNPMANLDGAETKIAQFERAYSKDNSDRMWSMTSRRFRAETTREEFENLNSVLQARLGAIESSDRSNFKLNSNNGITSTVVLMDTVFAQGEGQVTYTFSGHGEDMELVGWNVNSARLAVTVDDLQPAEE